MAPLIHEPTGKAVKVAIGECATNSYILFSHVFLSGSWPVFFVMIEIVSQPDIDIA